MKGGVATVKETSRDLTQDDEETAPAEGEVASGEDSGEPSSGKTKELLEDGAEAGEEYAKKCLGVSRAERFWAQKLGVDPYTSTEVLIREIKRVAKVDAAGGFSVRLMPIPRIPGANYLKDLSDLVWSMDPWELRELNKKKLADLGVPEELVESFFANAFYSPTWQTFLIGALGVLETVDDLSVAVALATRAESNEEALFTFETVRMLAGFHRGSTPIKRLVGGASVPAAFTGDRRLVYLLPVEHLSWTEGIAAAADGPFSAAGAELAPESRELWFRGSASQRCRHELEERGWHVLDRVQFAPEATGGR